MTKTSMNQSTKPVSGGLFLLLALSLLLGSAVSGSSAAPSADSHTFPETGHTVGGAFWSYWQLHGGLAQQGYPISEEAQEVSDLNAQTYTVQYFERAVFEKHPENKPPYDVLLSQLGTFRYKAKYGDTGAPGQQASTTNARFFPETKHTLGGKFRAYWESHGGLAQQGYPISDEFTEVSDLDNKSYTVQYFERAVFELHPENAGTPYEVLLSQLGKFRLQEKQNPPTATPEATGTPTAEEGLPPFNGEFYANTLSQYPWLKGVEIDWKGAGVHVVVGDGNKFFGPLAIALARNQNMSLNAMDGEFMLNYFAPADDGQELRDFVEVYSKLQPLSHQVDVKNLPIRIQLTDRPAPNAGNNFIKRGDQDPVLSIGVSDANQLIIYMNQNAFLNKLTYDANNDSLYTEGTFGYVLNSLIKTKTYSWPDGITKEHNFSYLVALDFIQHKAAIPYQNIEGGLIAISNP